MNTRQLFVSIDCILCCYIVHVCMLQGLSMSQQNGDVGGVRTPRGGYSLLEHRHEDERYGQPSKSQLQLW